VSWTLEGRPLRRILVTRLRYLGDIAMSTVVLEVLRRGDPDCVLGYCCEDGHASLLAGHPALNQVHALAAKRQGSDAAARAAQAASASGQVTANGTLGTVLGLRRARYDLAVDLFFNPRSAWLLRLAGIPLRIGGATSKSRRRLYTHQALALSPGERPGLHAVASGGLADHLARLAPLRHADGRLFLDWLEESVQPGALRPRLHPPALAADIESQLPTRGFTLLAPAATWPSKEWPAERWRDLAGRLESADGQPPVILCPPSGPGDLAGLPGLLPPLPLPTALQVVAAADRLVSADGGIMHASVAYGVPTLALFGPTDPVLWFPYENLGLYRVLATRPSCHPCDRHTCDEFICLPDLSVDMVVDALKDLGTREVGS